MAAAESPNTSLPKLVQYALKGVHFDITTFPDTMRDAEEIAEYLGLTTIRQLLYESGQLGVELMLDILEGLNAEPVCRVLPTELIIRGTTIPPTAG